MKKNAQTRRREWQTLFSAPTWQILKLEGLKWPPYLADYEDMLSLQWVTVGQKICPTDGLGGFLAGPARTTKASDLQSTTVAAVESGAEPLNKRPKSTPPAVFVGSGKVTWVTRTTAHLLRRCHGHR